MLQYFFVVNEPGADAGRDSPLHRLVESGAGVVGVSAGTALGFLADGAAGALVGSTSGALLQDQLKHVAGDLALRLTGASERERVGECFIRAHQLIEERLNNGEPLRDSSFFRRGARKERARLRSEAEQLLEGTFLAARDSYEERKVELLARFYASAAFSSLDAVHLNHVLSLVTRLTYRQLMILGVYGFRQGVWEGGGEPIELRKRRFSDGGVADTTGIVFELYELVTLSLLAPTDNTMVLSWSQVLPNELTVHATGAHLWNLLRPDVADPRGVNEVLVQLWDGPPGAVHGFVAAGD